jgi:glycerol-3-phosphate acyltransferase PlsY
VGSTPSPGITSKQLTDDSILFARNLKMTQWLVVLLGYLVGTFPTAYFFGKKITGKDIRQLGDGNMGARNAYHEIGHKIGILIFFIDAAKGALAVLLAQTMDVSQTAVLATGVAVVSGHNWPLFLRFSGGRGEATTIGVLYTLIPVPMLIMTLPTFIALLLVKNVIIASAVLFIGLPLVCWWQGISGVMVLYAIGLACLVGITHFFNRHRVEDTANEGTT